jgi:hypothetical protein
MNCQERGAARSGEAASETARAGKGPSNDFLAAGSPGGQVYGRDLGPREKPNPLFKLSFGQNWGPRPLGDTEKTLPNRHLPIVGCIDMYSFHQ